MDGGPSRIVKKNLLFFTSYKYLPFVLADAYLYISRIPGLIAGASVPSFKNNKKHMEML